MKKALRGLSVIPAEARSRALQGFLDPRFRGDDVNNDFNGLLTRRHPKSWDRGPRPLVVPPPFPSVEVYLASNDIRHQRVATHGEVDPIHEEELVAVGLEIGAWVDNRDTVTRCGLIKHGVE